MEQLTNYFNAEKSESILFILVGSFSTTKYMERGWAGFVYPSWFYAIARFFC